MLDLKEVFTSCMSRNISDNGSSRNSDPLSSSPISSFVKTSIIPFICSIGVLGNILSLVILTKRQATADRMERCVGIGLIGLAVSDLLFCLCLLPHAFFYNEGVYKSKSIELLYRIYHQPIINAFILTSTWLTVTMSLSRYMAICHPFRCRPLIGSKGTKATVVLVYVICIGFNIVRFLEFEVAPFDCQGQMYFFLKEKAAYSSNIAGIFRWCYLSFAIIIPLIVLGACNAFLVRALQKSSRLRKEYRVRHEHVDQNDRITCILIIITISYVILVVPSEILEVLQKFKIIEFKSFALMAEILNAFQTVNFAFNFALYYLLNVHFRRAMHSLLCYLPQSCDQNRKNGQLKESVRRSRSSAHGHIPLNPAPNNQKCWSNKPSTITTAIEVDANET